MLINIINKDLKLNAETQYAETQYVETQNIASLQIDAIHSVVRRRGRRGDAVETQYIASLQIDGRRPFKTAC
ncbi:MAG: hypothetical protein LBF59_00815 [Prevotellaceae bacterium]|jgi:hypothetical protein|nr:hypothetical protein [Prevotellaceae bacterium]